MKNHTAKKFNETPKPGMTLELKFFANLEVSSTKFPSKGVVLWVKYQERKQFLLLS